MDLPMLNVIYPTLTRPEDDVAKGMAAVFAVLLGKK